LDGSFGEKLFIVLNNPKESEPYIVVRTTTTEPEHSFRELCNPELQLFFIKKKPNGEVFKKDTFVQLSETFPFTQYDFLSGHFDSSLQFIGCLSNLCLRQLLNCIYKIKEDVITQHFKLIFG